MEVSEVCINPPWSPSSHTQTHTQSPSGGLESFNHGRHPTSPPASPADHADPEGCRSGTDADPRAIQ